MRKNICAALLTLFIVSALLLTGCGVAGALTAQAKLQQQAEQAVILADAATIASSINVHNAMLDTGSTDKITSITSLDDLKEKLGSLWPDNMNDGDAKEALPLVKVDGDGIATIDSKTN